MIVCTEKNIISAFNRLISKNNFDKITVSMIISEANISRSTFYRYFKDKYDVMNANYKLIIDFYLSNYQCHNYRDMFYYLFDTIQTSWKSLSRLFESTGINSFGNFIATYSYDTALNITKINRSGNGFTQKEAAQAKVFCFAVSEAFKEWIVGEFKLSSSEIADLLFEIAPPTLKYYWWE